MLLQRLLRYLVGSFDDGSHEPMERSGPAYHRKDNRPTHWVLNRSFPHTADKAVLRLPPNDLAPAHDLAAWGLENQQEQTLF